MFFNIICMVEIEDLLEIRNLNCLFLIYIGIVICLYIGEEF